KRPRLSLLIGYCISLTLAFYTLYFAILPLAVQIVVGLVWRFRLRNQNPLLNSPSQAREEIKPKWALIAAWIVTAVLYAPWLWVIATIQFPTLTTGIGSLPGTYAATLANIPVLGGLLLGTQWALLLGLGALGIWIILRLKGAHAGAPLQFVVALG